MTPHKADTIRSSLSKANGAVLVTAVILMVIAAVAALSVTAFITERMAVLESRILSEKALYLARAGISGAVFSYRFHQQSGNGYFSLGSYQADDSGGFILSADENDVLLVDSSEAQIGGEYCAVERQECEDACDETWSPCYLSCDDSYTVCVAACPPKAWQACQRECEKQRDAVCYSGCDGNKSVCYGSCGTDYEACMAESNDQNDFTGVFLRNATDSRSITIDRMVISWDNTRRLREVVIDGQIRWAGNAGSPAEVSLNPRVVLTGAPVPPTYPLDYLRFNNKMTGVKNIAIGFVMLDGTRKDVQVYPSGMNGFYFSVRSTGQTDGSSVSRTVQAAYQADPPRSRISDYHEID